MAEEHIEHENSFRDRGGREWYVDCYNYGSSPASDDAPVTSHGPMTLEQARAMQKVMRNKREYGRVAVVLTSKGQHIKPLGGEQEESQ
jgi:hypothetical protein